MKQDSCVSTFNSFKVETFQNKNNKILKNAFNNRLKKLQEVR